MLANRLFTLLIAIALVVVSALTTEVTLSRATSMDRESKEQAHQESQLEKRFGDIHRYIVEEDITALSYISRINRCFDKPFSEIANCTNVLD